MARRFTVKQPSVIPGFGIAMGFTLAYLGLILIVPLAALVFRSASIGWAEFLSLIHI